MRKTARTLVYCLITLTLIAPCAPSRGLAETTPRSVGLSQDHAGRKDVKYGSLRSHVRQRCVVFMG